MRTCVARIVLQASEAWCCLCKVVMVPYVVVNGGIPSFSGVQRKDLSDEQDGMVQIDTVFYRLPCFLDACRA